MTGQDDGGVSSKESVDGGTCDIVARKMVKRKVDALRSNLIRKISRCNSRINEEETVSLKMKIEEHEVVVLAPR